jgi:F-box protein, helicase, 18
MQQPVSGAAKERGALLDDAPLLGAARAFIARSNAALLSEAARAASNGQNVHFVGGPLAIDRAAALDCVAFLDGHEPRDPWRACFPDFDEYEAACRETGDAEGASLCALARERGSSLPMLFEAVDRRTVDDASKARLWLCSAHKAKGLEFDHVALADDFALEPVRTSSMTAFTEAERDAACVFYVAATRARRTLSLPDSAKAFAERFARAYANPSVALAEGFSAEDAARLADFKAREPS